MDYSEYIGKYVCYGNEDGGFCFGKIDSVVKVNTHTGLKDAFVMTDRTTCPGKPYVFRNISHQKGKTLLFIEKISLKCDIIEKKEEVFKDLTDDELFLLIMQGEVNLERLGSNGLGVRNLCESQNIDSEVVKGVLANRLK